jgi:L-alanine-DL-glutamate epimerase-like enolase superfamily enzyme
MGVGGPLALLEIAGRVRGAAVDAVVTTTVDSAVGNAVSLHTAAALADRAVHGLATGAWLRKDVAESAAVEGGFMTVGRQPGLGLVPHGSIQFQDLSRV